MELLTRNPFRLANLPSTATLDEVKIRLHEADLRRRAGIDSFVPLSTQLGTLDNLAALRSQISSLAADPVQQACFRYFWPVEGWPADEQDLDYCISLLMPAAARTKAREHLAFIAYLVRFTGRPAPEDALQCLRAWSNSYDFLFDSVSAAMDCDSSTSDWEVRSIERVEDALVGALLQGATSLRGQGRLKECYVVLRTLWEHLDSQAPGRERVLAALVDLGDGLEKVLKEAACKVHWNPGSQVPLLFESQQLRGLAVWLRGNLSQVQFWEDAVTQWNDAVAAEMQGHALALEERNDFAGAIKIVREALRLDISVRGCEILTSQLQELQRRQQNHQCAASTSSASKHGDTTRSDARVSHPHSPSSRPSNPQSASSQVVLAPTRSSEPSSSANCGSIFLTLAVLAAINIFPRLDSFLKGPRPTPPPVTSNSSPTLPPGAAPALNSMTFDSATPDSFESAAARAKAEVERKNRQQVAQEKARREQVRRERAAREKAERERSQMIRAERLGREHDTLVAELKRLQSELSVNDLTIQSRQSELDRLSNMIESTRPFVDNYNPYSIAAFNAQVDEYNQKLEYQRQRIRSYDAVVYEHNAKLARLQEIERVLGGMGLLRP